MTLVTAVKKRNVGEVRRLTESLPTSKIADLLESMEEENRLVFFRLLNPKVQSNVFSSLEDHYQEDLIRLFTDEQMKKVFQELYADEIADLIEEVPKPIARRILRNTPQTMLVDVKKILRYNSDEVGSIMTVEALTLKTTMTVGEAIKLVKNKRKDVYIENHIFVTKARGGFVGFITIEDLMFQKNTTKLNKIAKPCEFLKTTMDVEDAIHVFADSDMSELPVLDSKKQFAGVVASDDILELAIEEADEDMQKMAGVLYDDTPYSRRNTWNMFKARFLWLLLLMVSATISQIVLDAFQGFATNRLEHSNSMVVIAPVLTTAIVAILPVISGAAGNAGSQASTMVIRALATNDVSTKDYLRVFWKEFKVSFTIGAALAIANFIRLCLYYSATGALGDDPTKWLFLSFAASISLWVVIILAKVVGGLLPLLAKKLKLDPAVMAAPLLTTLIDALSTMIFFGISIGIMVMVI